MTRTSDIDFDEVPSPRPRGSVRKSMGHTSGSGPSRLSKSFNAVDMEEDSDPMDEGFDAPENGNYGGSPQESPQGTSFVQLDRDDDDNEPEEGDYQQEEEEELPEHETPSRASKGKARALSDVPEGDESEVEDEIAKGLENDGQRHSDEDEQVHEEDFPEPQPRKTKKAKFAQEEVKKPQGRPRGKSKKENRRESFVILSSDFPWLKSL